MSPIVRVAELLGVPKESIQHFFGIAQLASASLLTAIAWAGLAAGWLPAPPGVSVATLLLLLQWIALGGLLAKGGLDHFCFSRISAGRAGLPKFNQYFLGFVVPMSLASAVAIAVVFSPALAAFSFLIICLEAPTVIGIAAINGERRHGIAAWGSILNAPMFVLALYILSGSGSVSTFWALALLLAVKALRFVFVQLAVSRVTRVTDPLVEKWVLLAQQIGFFAILRYDQLALPGFSGLLPAILPIDLYVFLSRFPDLTNAAISLIGVVYFPAILNRITTRQWVGGCAAPVLGLMAISSLPIAAGWAIFLMTWQGGEFPFLLGVPFLCTSIAWPGVAFCMFALLRQEAITESVLMFARSLGFGGIAVGAVAFLGMGLWLPLAPPVACIAFLAQALRYLNGRFEICDGEASGGAVK